MIGIRPNTKKHFTAETRSKAKGDTNPKNRNFKIKTPAENPRPVKVQFRFSRGVGEKKVCHLENSNSIEK
jgi:hypothetical protein